MSGSEDSDTQTGISLLVSVDEQSLRSARANIEDVLTEPVSVAVEFDAPETVATPDVESDLDPGGLSVQTDPVAI